RKPVGQKVNEVEEVVATRTAEARRQIGNLTLGQKACEPVQRGVSKPSRRSGLRRGGPCADDEVVFAALRGQRQGIRRLMLAVGVDDHQELAGRRPDSRSE